LDYRLITELWAFTDHRIAVCFAYEWHDDSGHGYRSYGNENWRPEVPSFIPRQIGINSFPSRYPSFDAAPICRLRHRGSRDRSAPVATECFGMRLRGPVFRTQERRVPAPLKLKSAADCLRFEKESFGALHTMLAALDEAGKDGAWQEKERELRKFETASGFEGPYELIVVTGST
jgi:hypothetical protein